MTPTARSATVRAPQRAAHARPPAGKILPLNVLAEVLEEWRGRGKRIVQCHGVFDLLHAGHIRHLVSAKRHGDILVVTLTRDAHVRKGPGRPVFNEELRAETLGALEVVDYVALVDAPTAVGCIRQLRPHAYVKGPDYRDPQQDVTGMISEEARAVAAVGGQLVVTDDPLVLSSSSLINRLSGLLSDEQRAFVDRIRETHGPVQELVTRLQALRQLRVVLVGDTIIDEYAYCEPLGQSLKYPIVVHRHLREERFCGGVIAVANQVAEFCEGVDVVTVLGGRRSQAAYIRSKVRANVTLHPLVRPGVPTIVKRRYLYEDVEQKVFEVCHLEDGEQPPEALAAAVAARVCELASGADLVMVTDYGHGVMTKTSAPVVRERARVLAVNAQTNSANMGYNLITSKYRRPDFVCMDEGEARLALHDKHGPMEQLTEELAGALDIWRLIVTCGRRGSVGFERRHPLCVAPALATQVVDRVGAGDAFFAVTAPCSAIGLPLDVTSFIGNAIGALAVQVIGNRHPIRAVDLFTFIGTLLK